MKKSHSYPFALLMLSVSCGGNFEVKSSDSSGSEPSAVEKPFIKLQQYLKKTIAENEGKRPEGASSEGQTIQSAAEDRVSSSSQSSETKMSRPSQEPSSTENRKILIEIEQWRKVIEELNNERVENRPTSYSFVRTLSCFCPGPQSVFVSVTGGKVSFAQAAEWDGSDFRRVGSPLANPEKYSLLNAAEMAMKTVQEAPHGEYALQIASGKKKNSDHFSVEFSADPIPEASDDEYALRISNFVKLGDGCF